MKRHLLLIPAIAAALLLPPHPARPSPTTPPEVRTLSGQTIPAGAYGVVHIPHVASASLMQLHGKAGRGIAILRTRKPGHCVTVELRFVAGGFDGAGVSVAADGPVQLVLRSETVVASLLNGRDVVSDGVSIDAETGDPGADILIEAGLTGHHGFVLNPGRNGWAEIFGATHIDTPCDPV